MRIAIVGSRNYKNLNQVVEYVRTLPPDTIVVSGGAKGVDRTAVEAAQKYLRMRPDVYLPDYEVYGQRAPLIRNEHIVNNCDSLVAFHDGKSTGTLHTLSLAKKAGKPVKIFTADDAPVVEEKQLPLFT